MASPPVYVERLDSYFPPDGGAEFYAEIGRIVTLWGALDNNLDLALLHINRAERNPDLYTDRLRTHKHRRTALRNWLRNDPQIAHVRNDGEIIVLAAARIQTYRDVFAHGRFLEFKRGDPPKIVFSTIPIRSRKKGRIHTFSTSRLRQISTDLAKLQFASLALAVGAVGDGSMPSNQIYELARKRFPANLDQLQIVRSRQVKSEYSPM